MQISHEGEEYDIPGYGKLFLYPASKLIEKLIEAGYTKSLQTVRKWEANGIIPKSIFYRYSNRLYSMEQMECIVDCVVKCDVRRANQSLEKFSDMMWKELPRVNKKLKERGNENGTCEENSETSKFSESSSKTRKVRRRRSN